MIKLIKLMKLSLLPALMLCLSVSGFSQISKLGAAGKALAKQSAKTGGLNLSSKILKSRYALTAQSLQVTQQLHAQQVAAVLTDASLETAARLKILEQLKDQSAQTLAALNAQLTKEMAQWGDLLLRERNPNFLPKKDSSIPGLLAKSSNASQYQNISPVFFREWAASIPEVEEVPEEVNGLIGALRKRLMAMELEIVNESAAYIKAKDKLDPLGDPSVNRFYQGQMRGALIRLNRLSKESAQCVADLVYLLNLYPSFYSDSLKLLAAKLDNGLQTPFTTYLRAKIRVPKTPARRPIGFN